MEISGRLIKILQEVRGESQRGPWVRGGFVIETDGDYPRQVAFTTFGEDRLAMVKSIPLNTPVVVNFNPESREYEGRWYTDLRCSRIQNYVPGQMPPAATGYAWPAAPQAPAAPAAAPVPPQQPAAPAAAPAQPQAPSFASPLGGEDDLPF
ncbi:MAG: DUF3127 domain-containing protein [Bacteroidales bacterium]|jgi:hypothetical protein|nr:DUF3127 domain-containing protein [Bacteroidales bacterium]